MHALARYVVICAPLVLTPGRSFAQTSAEKSLAESLFREGKKLLAANKVEEACGKFEESQRLDPGSGTLLNLAACHEKQGRIAAAWTEYQDAADLAKKVKRADRVAIASRKAKELEPRVPRLVIELERPSDRSITGLVVALDGVELTQAALGSPLRVDPGTHTVLVSAPEFESFKGTVETPEQSTESLSVPPLTAIPKVLPPGPIDATPKSEGPTFLLPLAIGSAVFSGLSIAVGIGTGVHAMDLGRTSKEECPGGSCSLLGWDAYNAGHDFATASNVAFGLGIGLAAVSGGLFVTNALIGPKGDTEAAALLPACSLPIDPSSFSCSFRTRF